MGWQGITVPAGRSGSVPQAFERNAGENGAGDDVAWGDLIPVTEAPSASSTLAELHRQDH